MPALMLNGVNYSGAGGGNANEQVLTWAEYCALTPEEKMNGTTYYITDVNGDGQSFQPVIYSTEEREIGVFTDGKPLYEKTVTFTNVSRTGVIDLDLINVDNIFVHGGSYGQCIPLPYVHSDMVNGIGGFFETDSNGKWIWNVRGGSGAPSVTGWITVRYTKTTDSPGSGQWTPQGVPAVHYDGNEKVVGTWFGETLYEKTIYIGTLTKDSSWHNITHNISNINNVVSCVGSFRNTVDNMYFNLPMHRPGQQNGILIGCDSDYVKYTNTWIDTAVDGYATIRYTKATS